MKAYIKGLVPDVIKKAYRSILPKIANKPETAMETQKPSTEIIDCPYCGSKEAAVVKQVADIVKCSSCGLIYLRTRPTKEALYKIYQTYANSTSHLKLPETIDEAKKSGLRREWFVNDAASYCKEKKGIWLDIGCAWGALLMYAREVGFTPIGLEMTRNCLDFASMQLRIPVSNSLFTDSEMSENSCRVISMVHVLEHIPNPKETLLKIYNTLTPGGIYCGIVPNIESYCSERQGENWVWLDPTHHYCHYSPATLKQKLEEAGFITEKIYTAVGDGNVFFTDTLKKEFPSITAEEIAQKWDDVEKNGTGEEIRFFVRKPGEPSDTYESENVNEQISVQAPKSVETEIISCPYCHSKDATRVKKLADIVKCGACGLTYLRTRPTKEALYQIYQVYANDTSHLKLPDSLAEAKSSGLRREWFVNETMKYSSLKTGNWLDIGCAWGALLSYVRESGFSPMGIEMTRNCLDFATMVLQIPVSNSQFTDSEIIENSCQVISMVHVLEHIPNPPETLTKIFNTLAPGGVFCGIVPNIESYCSDRQGENWVWLDATHHYVHYSPATLKQKLEEAGFVIDSLYTSVGDGIDFFNDILKEEYPSLSEHELNEKKRDLELNGKGEEIRFFVRKP